MLTRLSAKLLLLAVLLIIPAVACSLTSDSDNNGGNRPTLIPTTFVFVTATPFGTATLAPTATTAPAATAIPQATRPPVVSQPCVAPAGWIPYRVVAGDTVGNIAQRTGTTAAAIANGNCLANANAIYVGQLLYIPNVIIVTNTPVVIACTLPPRLTVGAQGRVVPGSANALRTQPGTGPFSIVLGQIPGSGVFTVLAGPQCADGYYWWQVNYNGVTGWTAEGQGLTYWLEPYAVQGCTMPTHLQAGRTGRVTPGLGNALRTQPGTDAGSVVIGQIPAGGMFRVIQGPQCVNGYNWWQVIYNGVTGWTAEGDATTYWAEPLVCPSSHASQLLPGMTARVTPGLPNRLRLTPGTDGAVISEIPGGATISILDGPQCGVEGWLWWQVNYNGTIGWTAEGDLTSFWLEPVF